MIFFQKKLTKYFVVKKRICTFAAALREKHGECKRLLGDKRAVFLWSEMRRGEKKIPRNLVRSRKSITFAVRFFKRLRFGWRKSCRPCKKKSSLKDLHDTRCSTKRSTPDRLLQSIQQYSTSTVNKKNRNKIKTGILQHRKKNKFSIFNNGEFDPGSGWTLATGLTHASRGAARVAIPGGDRRTGE